MWIDRTGRVILRNKNNGWLYSLKGSFGTVDDYSGYVGEVDDTLVKLLIMCQDTSIYNTGY